LLFLFVACLLLSFVCCFLLFVVRFFCCRTKVLSYGQTFETTDSTNLMFDIQLQAPSRKLKKLFLDHARIIKRVLPRTVF
jgi:hypothetical protein